MLLVWLKAFMLTQAIEMPVTLWALRRDKPAAPPFRNTAIAFGASAITHPFVWFVFPKLFTSYITYLIVAESFAVIIEALYLHFFGVRRALLVSLVANGLSAGAGLLIHHFFKEILS